MYTGFHVMYGYSCQILIQVELSSQIFKRHWNIKFHEKRPLGAKLFIVYGWKDRHNEANICFSQFCEQAYKSWAML